jgi:hypothetical protein
MTTQTRALRPIDVVVIRGQEEEVVALIPLGQISEMACRGRVFL